MTTPRRLPDQRTVYRIGDPAGTYPVFSPEGARLVSGRWHAAGAAVIYAAEHYSTALLEQLAHWNGVLPPNQHSIEIALPAGLSYEVVTRDSLPDWRQPNGNAARRFGMGWYRERRGAVLFVPSVVAPLETNVVINATHPEFADVRGDDLEKPVAWDDRLFR
ncbi:RES family NAD+ phosphorylase [Amorphus sp. MBR-141]